MSDPEVHISKLPYVTSLYKFTLSTSRRKLKEISEDNNFQL